jgi:predicted RecA/RadA family phage recombinase
MATTYKTGATTVDYTSATAISAGAEILVGSLIGIAMNDIAATVQGALATSGVYKFAKTGGSAGEAFTAGQKVYWESDGGGVASTGTYLIGIAWPGASYAGANVAETTDTTVYVKINDCGNNLS